MSTNSEKFDQTEENTVSDLSETDTSEQSETTQDIDQSTTPNLYVKPIDIDGFPDYIRPGLE